MKRYSIETRTRKYVKGYGFLSFVKNGYALDKATKTVLDALKIASKKVVHKAVEASAKFTGNIIAHKIVKP